MLNGKHVENAGKPPEPEDHEAHLHRALGRLNTLRSTGKMAGFVAIAVSTDGQIVPISSLSVPSMTALAVANVMTGIASNLGHSALEDMFSAAAQVQAGQPPVSGIIKP